jgi:hypothetical protein
MANERFGLQARGVENGVRSTYSRFNFLGRPEKWVG